MGPDFDADKLTRVIGHLRLEQREGFSTDQYVNVTVGFPKTWSEHVREEIGIPARKLALKHFGQTDVFLRLGVYFD